jgi:hypothetical protein
MTKLTSYRPGIILKNMPKIKTFLISELYFLDYTYVRYFAFSPAQIRNFVYSFPGLAANVLGFKTVSYKSQSVSGSPGKYFLPVRKNHI